SLYRLSDLQQGMLFHALYEHGSGAYVEQFGCELANVDVAQFINSWAHLIRRHSILRSGFEYDTFKVPIQCVYKEAVMPVDVLDYRKKNEAEQARAIRDYEDADRRRGFDFKAPPLMRVALFRLSEERYYMLWSHHHIICDGWSGSLLMGEFLSVYENMVTGTELPDVPEDKYEDYIRYIESRDKHKEQQYWRSYLKGVEAGSLLPFIATKTERNKGLGQYKQALLFLDEHKTATITAYAQSHKITVNTIMQGVWSYLLHRYTGNAHIVYGVTVSGRPDDLPGVEDRVGMYINTLPLHSLLGESLGITEWLQSIQQQQLESREHQYTGLNTIQGWTGIQGDLFDTLLVFENYPVSKVISSRSWLLEASNPKVQEQGNYPLTITVNAGAA
ncbi:condensation domain-containing protein, partial [Mucilaginibacter sp. RCC_168]|uniref:condensation domain-containing protein n=1 Tax=Mucilaginibacter sp. RCC_168 TaxID=3239221 RepID=UPI0035231C9D